MSALSESGYVDALFGRKPRSDDPEYMRGYIRGQSARNLGGWRNQGGALTSLPEKQRPDTN